MSTDPDKKQPPDEALLAWLNQQAAALRTLVTRGWKLQSDYLQNGREKGAVLVEVRRRLGGTTLTFAEWVESETDIGLSTAYLWMDVAESWDEIEAWWQKVRKGTHSNPLETSLRAVRSLLRDLRQARGGGKPGSGKKKAIAGVPGVLASNEAADEASVHPEGLAADQGDVNAQQEGADDQAEGGRPPPAKPTGEAKHTKLFNCSKPGGEGQQADDGKEASRPRPYKVTVVTPAKADLETFGALLPSPIIDFNAHSVHGWVGFQDIDKTLAAVGNALGTTQPRKVKVIVEL